MPAIARAQIFRKEPFFHGHDNYDQLVKIAKVLGTGTPAPLALANAAQKVHGSGRICDFV
jgi:hypothetical protein